jgi:hypothetical protein
MISRVFARNFLFTVTSETTSTVVNLSTAEKGKGRGWVGSIPGNYIHGPGRVGDGERGEWTTITALW